MRAVITRVRSARVEVGSECIAQIGLGLCVLLGVGPEDTEADARWMAEKVRKVRVFADGQGKMNLDLSGVAGEVLAVSQFTLFGDLRRGNRPSFGLARAAAEASPLFLAFCQRLVATGVRVKSGRFGADMAVHSHNDGPVTLLLDSQRVF